MTREEAAKWLEEIKEKYVHGGDEQYDKCRRKAIDKAVEELKKPGIILCENCVHGTEYGGGTQCEFDGFVHNDEHFCGYAEARKKTYGEQKADEAIKTCF